MDRPDADRGVVRDLLLRLRGRELRLPDRERDLPDGDARAGDRVLLRGRDGGRRHQRAAAVRQADRDGEGVERLLGLHPRRVADDHRRDRPGRARHRGRAPRPRGHREAAATGCAGSPTARPARARTGSAGSTPSSARSRSSSPALPGASSSYRALPQLRLRSGGAAADGMGFDELGYASAAMASHRDLSRACAPRASSRRPRPLPSSPCRRRSRLSAAFVALEHQADRGARLRGSSNPAREVEAHPRRHPGTTDLAIQWDARYDRSRCSTARSPSGSAECVPASSSGGAAKGRAARCRRRSSSATTCVTATTSNGHFSEPTGLQGASSRSRQRRSATGSKRPLNWIHMPVPESRDDDGWFSPMARTCGSPPEDRALPRPPPPRRSRRGRAAPDRGRAPPRAGLRGRNRVRPGRGTAEAVLGLLELHRGVSAPLPDPAAPLPRLARPPPF